MSIPDAADPTERQPTARAAWSLFSADGERKYDGNDGYPDELGVRYVYDNKVSYSLQVRVGDVVLLRGSDEVLGISRVEHIDTKDNVPKKKRVCPKCGGARFDVRRHQRPRYRCRRESCHHEFEQPRETTTPVTQYVAHYQSDYRPLAAGELSVAQLKTQLRDNAPQNAIRPVDQVWASTLFAELSAPPPHEIPPPDGTPLPSDEPPSDDARPPHDAAPSDGTPLPGDAALPSDDEPPATPRPDDTPSPDDEPPTPPGGHREGRARIRIGQGKFRANLLARYGAQCAITGPCPEAALEAAHLESFATHETHENGLLLCADVHKLFDRRLLAVHPDTLQVEIAPELAGYERYVRLVGVRAQQITDREALRGHYLDATAAWTNR